ncbi:MAG: ATP-dependent sacrificial sulfur transferase LarE [Acidobacteriota bacterium]
MAAGLDGGPVEADAAGLLEKEATLRARLAAIGSVVVAFSGGTDSAYLAYAATAVLGDRATCVTADSPSYPARHRRIAVDLARDFHLHHEFIVTAEIDNPDYRANAPDRCYHCKHELFTHLAALALTRGVAAVLDGANADDRGDYRPGRAAALELGVLSPLDEVGLTKDEIRALSRRAGLPTWNQPASACLSSRIPYHSEVTPEKLRTIDGAEEVLRSLGFRVYRVRHHDNLARVELGPDEMTRALEPTVREALVRRIKAAGYQYVALDLQGYRMGSLNEGILLKSV